MSSFRVEKINALLKKELNKIFLKEFDFSPEVFITITRVETSSNLIESKVYISVIPKKAKKEVFDFLNKEIYHIQQKINKALRMRPVPKIIFKEEKETERAGEVERILKEIKDENLKKNKK
ncbi:MAG TPA: 30S ribosome-binding factor RbfA [Candidatus Pacearchaeota archaeon]|nr:30S ribosome-binding factor RbfA [Candidatus Pacearchaeota archaeon]